MKTKPQFFVAIIIVSGLLLVLAGISTSSPSNVLAADSTDLKSAIETKLQELQQINQQITKTQQEIEAAQRQQRGLKQELSIITNSVNQVNLGIKKSQITIEKLSLEIDSLQEQIIQVEAEIAIKRETVIKLLRELQEADNNSLLLALLEKKSLAELFLESQSIQNLNAQLSSEVVDLKVLQAGLNDKFQDRSAKKGKVVTENENLKNRRVILGEQKTQQTTLLSQTRSQELLYKQQLTELEKKQQAVSDAIEAIEDELRRTFDPTILPIKRPGVLGWPVEEPVITQRWGEVSWLYRGKPHNGTDFGAPLGTAVFAADDGQVISVGNNGRYQYGRYIVIKHGNNLATLYAHLSRQVAVEGGAVKRGALIGYSGSTGYSTGPHLHFGLYWAPSLRFQNVSSCNCGLVPIGITINPLDYL